MSDRDRPPELARCDEHGLVLLEGDTGHHSRCVACETGATVRLGERPEGPPMSDSEFRDRITIETANELVPVVEEYVADQKAGDGVWLTHFAWPGDLPAGYGEQERFVLAVGYRWAAMKKFITDESSARQTIEALVNAGYDDG